MFCLYSVFVRTRELIPLKVFGPSEIHYSNPFYLSRSFLFERYLLSLLPPQSGYKHAPRFDISLYGIVVCQ